MKQCESSTLYTLGCEGCSLPDALIKCTAFDSELSYDAPLTSCHSRCVCRADDWLLQLIHGRKRERGRVRESCPHIELVSVVISAYIARVKLSSRPVSIAVLSHFHEFNFNLCFLPGFPLYFPFRFSCSPRFFKCQCIRVVRSAFHSLPPINVGN